MKKASKYFNDATKFILFVIATAVLAVISLSDTIGYYTVGHSILPLWLSGVQLYLAVGCILFVCLQGLKKQSAEEKKTREHQRKIAERRRQSW